MPLITFFRMILSPSSSSLPYSSSYFSSLPSILSYITSHSYQHHHYIQQQSQLLPMLISIKSTVPAQSVENWFGKREHSEQTQTNLKRLSNQQQQKASTDTWQLLVQSKTYLYRHFARISPLVFLMMRMIPMMLKGRGTVQMIPASAKEVQPIDAPSLVLTLASYQNHYCTCYQWPIDHHLSSLLRGIKITPACLLFLVSFVLSLIKLTIITCPHSKSPLNTCSLLLLSLLHHNLSSLLRVIKITSVFFLACAWFQY